MGSWDDIQLSEVLLACNKQADRAAPIAGRVRPMLNVILARPAAIVKHRDAGILPGAP